MKAKCVGNEDRTLHPEIEPLAELEVLTNVLYFLLHLAGSCSAFYS